MDAKRLKEMTEEIRRLAGDEPFRPFAFFDERLGRIWVLVEDCSVTEERINYILTVFEKNYPEEGDRKYVGFAIEGARQFCSNNGLPMQGDVGLRDVLDAFIAACPKHASLVNERLRPLLEEFHLYIVEWPRPAA